FPLLLQSSNFFGFGIGPGGQAGQQPFDRHAAERQKHASPLAAGSVTEARQPIVQVSQLAAQLRLLASREAELARRFGQLFLVFVAAAGVRGIGEAEQAAAAEAQAARRLRSFQFNSEDEFIGMFQHYASQSLGGIQAEELCRILNEHPSIRNYYRVTWSLELCKIMLAMLDRSRDGVMQYAEFRELLTCLLYWHRTFQEYDRDRSGFIEANELHNIISSRFLYRLSAKSMTMLLKRYSKAMDDGRCLVAFDDFVTLSVRLRTYTEAFRARDRMQHNGETGTCQFSYDDFLQCTMSLCERGLAILYNASAPEVTEIMKKFLFHALASQAHGSYKQRMGSYQNSQYYGSYGQHMVQNVYSRINPWQSFQFRSENEFMSMFHHYSSPSLGGIQAHELCRILNEHPSIRNYYRITWSLELCRVMLAMMDRSRDGIMQYDEFSELLTCLVYWHRTFQDFDRNRSGYIEAHELHNIITNHFHYMLSPQAMTVLLKRYSRAMNDGRCLLAFDDFVNLSVRLRAYTESFRARDQYQHNGSETGTCQFTYDDFLQCTMSLQHWDRVFLSVFPFGLSIFARFAEAVRRSGAGGGSAIQSDGHEAVIASPQQAGGAAAQAEGAAAAADLT
uniref:EF-hand domain-containing protein n=2 Tax=Macrostomum lignano TaxID=282301 RepID=A0A1I8GQN4_9PLAT